MTRSSEHHRPVEEDVDPVPRPDGVSFVERWQGAFEPAEKEGERYRNLAEKYLRRRSG